MVLVSLQSFGALWSEEGKRKKVVWWNMDLLKGSSLFGEVVNFEGIIAASGGWCCELMVVDRIYCVRRLIVMSREF